MKLVLGLIQEALGDIASFEVLINHLHDLIKELSKAVSKQLYHSYGLDKNQLPIEEQIKIVRKIYVNYAKKRFPDGVWE